jgi:alcohol dehydrogenase
MIPADLPQLSAFDSQLTTRLVFGPGTVDRVGELARELGARRALLVTDPGIMAAGHGPRVQALLRSAGITVILFDRAQENPTTRGVEDCVAVARGGAVDTLVGLGGGSAMDTAKGCNFLLTNGGRMQDYWGVGKAVKPMLPLLAIPTTAGTGSECQSAALIADEHTHQKMACLDPKAAARIALLDPVLTLSQPARVTAVTGWDAIAHAVESAVTTRRTALSVMHSHQAFQLLTLGFPWVLREPANLAARAHMQLGAALAGRAIEQSMLGAAHAAANPLTARHGIVHGEAVGLMLPGVVRYNGGDAATRQAYAALALAGGLVETGVDPADATEALATALERFRALAHLPASLAACGVDSSRLAPLAAEAAQQWTARFNPRPLGAQDFEALYRAAL